MSRQIILKLQKIAKAYGPRIIFRNLDLELEAGESVLVTGSNGSGKSTLMRIIAGLSAPDGGSVIMDENRRMAYLGHATFLYSAMSALENLAFWGEINNIKIDRQLLAETLDRVKLLPYADEKARVFSRGMAQRLNFARVLLLDPDIFLLDEPFTGMDLESQEMLRAELVSRRGKGASIIMVSHSPDMDACIADKIFEIKKRELSLKSFANSQS